MGVIRLLQTSEAAQLGHDQWNHIKQDGIKSFQDSFQDGLIKSSSRQCDRLKLTTIATKLEDLLVAAESSGDTDNWSSTLKLPLSG